MEQQNSSFYNLKDFKKSNLKALTSVDLQLKNQTLDDKQLTKLNNSLKKCSNLESLILNLQKESISDEQINKFFENYQIFKCQIPTCNSMSNDQRYSHMKFLLEACNQRYNAISIKNKQNEIEVYGNILKEDVICNLINLKQLELNLNFNKSNGSGASYFVSKLTELTELITLMLDFYDINNLIEDEQYSNMARFISKIIKLKTLPYQNSKQVQVTTFEALMEIFEKIKQQFKGKGLLFPPQILSFIYDEQKEKNIYLTSFLAQGGQGMIFEAKMNNQIVIVKCLQLQNEEQIIEEMSIFEQIKDIPNICEIITGIKSSCESRYYQIFKKYSCDLSNAMQFLFDQKKTLAFNSIVGIALLISKVILSLPNMLHSDLKPTNILFDKLSQTFVLSDYGAAKQFKEGSFTKNFKAVDQKYRAPEFTEDDLILRKKYDVFCLGLIILEMTMGRFLTEQEALQIRKGNLETFISQKPLYTDLNNIIKSMLIIDQNQRINCEQFVQQLNQLKLNLENQFQNAVLGKVEDNRCTRMIQGRTKVQRKQKIIKVQKTTIQGLLIRYDKHAIYQHLSRQNIQLINLQHLLKLNYY
ncbi:hypothetical protein ABPG72_017844 [Tetrahymena utriculariae]